MNSVRQFIFPAAIVSSIFLASFGYSVMAQMETQAGGDESSTFEQIQLSVQPDGSTQDKENSSSCAISQSFPGSVRQWCNQIMRHASKNNLDPNLVAAIIWQESGGDPSAYSKSGAVGLMQVMPRDGIAADFQCVNGPCFTTRPTIDELQKPNFNIKYGTGMIAGLLNKYGDTREALKYYGPMNVGYYYADKVLSIYQSNSN
ncbi:MAG: transglycosylase SLT domain-containing protein [Anaerolineales bacterium]